MNKMLFLPKRTSVSSLIKEMKTAGSR